MSVDDYIYIYINKENSAKEDIEIIEQHRNEIDADI